MSKVLKTYNLNHSINKNKLKIIDDILINYRILSYDIAQEQWKNYEKGIKLNKFLDIKHIESKLSERYKQTCQSQVVGMLESYLSNIGLDFKKYVYKSNIDKEIKHKLYLINKFQAYYITNTTKINKYNLKSYLMIEKNNITFEDLKLAKLIHKQLLKRNHKPRYNKINMNLDSKVAKITKKGLQNEGKKSKLNTASHFDYWIELSTLTPRKTIKLPIISNDYYENKSGKQNNFVQINKNQITNNYSFGFIKETNSKEQEEQYSKNIVEKSIAIDLGFKNLFATNKGDLIIRNFNKKLKYYDRKLIEIQRKLQQKNVKLHLSKKYKILRNKIKNYIKNESNRGLNKIIKLYNPKEIIVERLDFTSPKLSRRMNRLLRNIGQSIIRKKLNSLQEEYGVNIVEINPAYTSKECSSCGYIDKINRKSQETFICAFCGKKHNADINASKVILSRSSLKVNNIDISNIYLNRKTILDKLLTQFIEQQKCHNSLTCLKYRTKNNYYFSEHDISQIYNLA